MHHKRKKAKNQRAGCLMCKPHKMNGYGMDCEHSQTRKEIVADAEIKEFKRSDPRSECGTGFDPVAL